MPILIFPPGSGPISVNVSGVYSEGFSGGDGATVFVFGSGLLTTAYTVEKGGALSVSFPGLLTDTDVGTQIAGPVILVSAVEAIGYVVDRGSIFVGTLGVTGSGILGIVSAQVAVDASGVGTTTDAGAIGGSGPILYVAGVRTDTAVCAQSTTLGGTLTVAAAGVEADSNVAQLVTSSNDQTAVEATADVGGLLLATSHDFSAVLATGDVGGQNEPVAVGFVGLEIIGSPGTQSLEGAISLAVDGIGIDAILGADSLTTTYDLASVTSTSDVGTITAGSSPVVQAIEASGTVGGLSLSSSVDVVAVEADAIQGGDQLEPIIRTSAVQAIGRTGVESLTLGGGLFSSQAGVLADAIVGGFVIDYPADVDVDGVESDAFAGIGHPPTVMVYPDPFLAGGTVIGVDPFAARSSVSVDPFAATARLAGQ